MNNRRTVATSVALCCVCAVSAQANPPQGIENVEILSELADPATMAFPPNGRLFIAERIEGRLRVAKFDDASGEWLLNPEPFYTFDVPADGGGVPSRYASSGLRGFAFDPDFEENGYIYCFYMKSQPRHNRVVRIQQSAANEDVAEPGETLLLDLPLNSTASSGSHNGGAVIFGTDGMLYISTGDGWVDGDDVQSLSTFTGKILRIQPDGGIPADNPFYTQASGNYRAIYALGLRNPFTVALHPVTGEMFINDVSGPNKSNIYLLAPGANYGHDGYGGIGPETEPWGDGGTSSSMGSVISGGAWLPQCGPFPEPYRGRYITALWGTNASAVGAMTMITEAGGDPVGSLLSDAGIADPLGDLKPMSVVVGPDGWLYYLASSYEAASGRVFVIRPSGPGSADLDANGSVGVNDLLILLSEWGPCDVLVPCTADIVGDCNVNVDDLLALLESWG